MTIPSERTRAVVNTQYFLYSLINPSLTPRVPKKIREEAARLLRHYPWSVYLDASARELPTIWGKVEKDDK